ncbi:16S rRNA (cytosine(1402)-N(4))-methyltransferase RsmH [Rhodanobacter glycinis]|uniref:Ribosomal RNA small subunit methyltransferase H n=1 Tax=Rhodanobacter glycinis TaxID=582702 RepID=A0A502CGF5_9GAMM|nr:16S rRNA (cytosine(1402)-N(4))-methyltransferase RsmH [Rhodanobacter glycinis]TPG11802.1 16S rRNA (cytosine(1402)-N(4))-methyltransferase RsmH [Rhodanobacter glycinis]TPG47343.1 16S rRNA (cytosine(1402)-N(4))-methyltransferase RsmH [Rhodanobacter glycinis]
MAEQQLRHIPVMLGEAVEGLSVQSDGRYLDGTFGRGGHARAVLSRLGPAGRLLLMDRDPTAIATAQAEFAGDSRVSIRHANFSSLAEWDETAAGLDGVLFDLGVSSPQLDDASRGFSFMADAPLDMRMDTTQGESAADFLAHASEREITEVLWNYGEERHGRRIARAIVADRTATPFTRTGQLAALIERVVGRREPGKHPATRSFQALRIRVNGELDALQQGLNAALERLKPGGRLSVISFHSLEDRAVKMFIRDHSGRVKNSRRGPPVTAAPARLVAIGKAQFPSDAEMAANPRSRSAVLRVAEKLVEQMPSHEGHA